MIESPIFLVASVRSGTTLLRLMLDHHRDLAFEHEFTYTVDWYGGDSWPDLPTYYERLSMDRVYLMRRYTIDRSLTYPELVDDFLVQRRSSAGKGIVGATVHSSFDRPSNGTFDRLCRIWPRARYLHLVRDGRDVSRSIIEMGLAGNMWTASAIWENAELAWEVMRPSLSDDRFLEIRYEELLRQPEETLARICRFVGLEYDPAMMSYPSDSTYGPPDPTAIDRWRHLSEDEVRLAEARIGTLLERRGYERSGHPPLVLTQPMKRRLERQTRRWRLESA